MQTEAAWQGKPHIKLIKLKRGSHSSNEDATCHSDKTLKSMKTPKGEIIIRKDFGQPFIANTLKVKTGF